MALHTGGSAVGTTSTKSTPNSSAIRSASASGYTSDLIFSPTSRTCGARILSLILCSSSFLINLGLRQLGLYGLGREEKVVEEVFFLKVAIGSSFLNG